MKSKILLTTLITALAAGGLVAKQGSQSGPGDRQPPSPEKMLEIFDTNGDGVIDLEEIEAHQERRQQMRQERLGEKGQSKDKNAKESRPGRDPAKMAVFIVEKFDTDGNGELSIEEVEAFLVQKQNQMGQGGKDRPKGPPADRE